VSATDVDSAPIAYAVVGTAPAGLTFNPDGSYSFDPGNAAYDALAQDATTVVTVTFSATADGQSDTGTLSLTVTGTNDGPTFASIGDPAAVNELADASAQAVTATGAIVVNDPDTGDTLTLTEQASAVTRSGGTAVPTLVANALNATALSFGGPLPSTGGDVSFNYTYAPAIVGLDFLADGETLTISKTVQVDDGSGNVIAADTVEITITGQNDAAIVTAGGTAAYVENAVGVSIGIGLTLVDVDDTELEGATVAIGTGFVGGQDFLTFSDQNGITGVYDDVAGVMTLSGTATLAHYQAALASVNYTNNSDAPDTTDREISISVNDGSVDSSLATSTVTVEAVNDGPVILGATSPGSILVNDSDVWDRSQVFGQGIDLHANGAFYAGDVLNFDITGQAQSGITFHLRNQSGQPLDGMQSFRVSPGDFLFYTQTLLTDQSKLSYRGDAAGVGGNPGFIVDASVVSGGLDVLEDGAGSFTNLSISDPDAGTGDLTINLSVTDGALALGSTTGLVFSDADGSDGTLAFTGTIDAVNAALAALDYSGDADFNGQDALSITVDDDGNTGTGGGQSDTREVVIDVAAVDDAPVAADSSESVVEGDAVLSGSVSATDVDSAVITYAVVGTAPAGLTFNPDGSYDFDPGNAAYDGLAHNETTTLSVTFSATADGQLDTGTLSITVTGVENNAAPTFVSVLDPVAVDELADASAQSVTAAGGISVNDLDTGDTLTLTEQSTAVTLSTLEAVPTLVADALNATALSFSGPLVSNGGDIAFTYTYAPTAADLDFLGAGETLTISKTIQVNDGSGNVIAAETVDIVINGTNDPLITVPIDLGNLSDFDDPIAIDLLAGQTDVDLSDTPAVEVSSFSFSWLGDLVGPNVSLEADGQTVNFDPTDLDALDVGDTATLTINYDVVSGVETIANTATLTLIGAATTTEDDWLYLFVPDLAGDGSLFINSVEVPTMTELGAFVYYDGEAQELVYIPTVSAEIEGLAAGSYAVDSFTYTYGYSSTGTSSGTSSGTSTGTSTGTGTGTSTETNFFGTETIFIRVNGVDEVLGAPPEYNASHELTGMVADTTRYLIGQDIMTPDTSDTSTSEVLYKVSQGGADDGLPDYLDFNAELTSTTTFTLSVDLAEFDAGDAGYNVYNLVGFNYFGEYTELPLGLALSNAGEIEFATLGIGVLAAPTLEIGRAYAGGLVDLSGIEALVPGLSPGETGLENIGVLDMQNFQANVLTLDVAAINALLGLVSGETYTNETFDITAQLDGGGNADTLDLRGNGGAWEAVYVVANDVYELRGADGMDPSFGGSANVFGTIYGLGNILVDSVDGTPPT